jgi:hypothetical protein
MAASATRVLKSGHHWPCHAFGMCGRLVRAVRPLAASASLASLHALEGCAGSGASSPLRVSSFGHNRCRSFSKASLGQGSLPLGRRKPSHSGQKPLSQSSRLRARQCTAGRASTSCFAARAGEVRLLAGGATQRTMRRHAGPVPLGARPNPSIERTRPGKPGRASHVKRWASR